METKTLQVLRTHWKNERDAAVVVLKIAREYGFIGNIREDHLRLIYAKSIVYKLDKFQPPVAEIVVRFWFPDILAVPKTIKECTKGIEQYNAKRRTYVGNPFDISTKGKRDDIRTRFAFIFHIEKIDFDTILAKALLDEAPVSKPLPPEKPLPILPDAFLCSMPLAELVAKLPPFEKRKGVDDVEDNDVVITYADDATKCPIGLTEIRIAVRGKLCEHDRCFDLENFLQFAQVQKHWGCPICKRDAHPLQNLCLVV